ncbi:MAG TPA: DUF1460 domain-containing protein [Providencia sp.]|uniref:N-acetylmuramoyl-L-alanine amidase-like domain-containing protein n=1 Tax=Providencia sp. TaxID=589 RepID=UPI000E7E4B4C|nr:N-acetylmuramoyl-L-alanine amidase-like domain-containing protein [Providencia sp.]MBP6081155.1 DUF1460 domain-containing protein [Providencia sp.]HBO21371.1 DUF1460 domain-containing protein [Providencia sp.]
MYKCVGAVVIFLASHWVSADVVFTSGSYSILENVLVESQNTRQELKTKAITQTLLSTPYSKSTLNMNPLSVERLIVDLNAMDCMTFIEYTEAFRRAENYQQFISNLINIRYIDQQVTFSNRRHFFTDWAQESKPIAVDITTMISSHAVPIEKKLNWKGNGGSFISGLGVKARLINYIPTRYVDEGLIELLKTGDYIGIYSKNQGLDVTHVGIVIKENKQVVFRNASSLRHNLKVSDVELRHYLDDKVGIIVFRSSLDYYSDIN